MSGNYEHQRLQATAADGTYARECAARWESERNERWVEDPSGRLWPRPGFEPKTFTEASRMQRDNALVLEAKRKL